MVAAVLMDLSKAYGCIPHDLLIAKLNGYGIDSMGLLLISDYLSRHKPRTKTGSSYSSWHDIVRGVPQGSLLGPLLFNIFIDDFFLFIRKSGVCNFPDDNTLYSVGKNIENVISDLKTDLIGVMEWFKINSFKANPGKFQFMVLGYKDERYFNIHINNVQIKNSNTVTLLGIIIDKNLTFKTHISELCRRASYKLHSLPRIRKYLTVERLKLLNLTFKTHISELCRRASYKLHSLPRIRKYLTVEKLKLLANVFINSQFSYASLIWMFANKCSIDKILKIQKRTLQIVHGVYDESYENLLNRSGDISLHQKHLAIQVYKSLAKLNPGFMWNFFERNHTPYNLRRGDLLLLPPAKSFRGSLFWNNLPPQVKESQTLQEFKNRIKNLRSIRCTYTVCR